MPCFCVLSMKLAGHLFVPGSDFYKLLSYYRTHVDAFSIKKKINKSSLHRAERYCLPAKYPTLQLSFPSPGTTCSLTRSRRYKAALRGAPPHPPPWG